MNCSTVNKNSIFIKFCKMSMIKKISIFTVGIIISLLFIKILFIGTYCSANDTFSPTVKMGDYLFINKISNDYVCGDIVVFFDDNMSRIGIVQETMKDSLKIQIGKCQPCVKSCNESARSYDLPTKVISQTEVYGKVIFQWR